MDLPVSEGHVKTGSKGEGRTTNYDGKTTIPVVAKYRRVKKVLSTVVRVQR